MVGCALMQMTFPDRTVTFMCVASRLATLASDLFALLGRMRLAALSPTSSAS
jgi:hypothetical protein